MRIILSRIKAVGPWLAETWHVWVSLVVIVLAVPAFIILARIGLLRPPWAEPAIRITGGVVQLLGIGTVIWGIQKTRALFGHPSLWNGAKAWLVRFPLLRKNGVSAEVNAPLANIELKSTARLSVEARLEALEKTCETRFDQIQQEVDKKIADEKRSRVAEDREIGEKLEKTETGGVQISLMGAICLFSGVILSTASKEIAEFADWLGG